MINSGFTFNGIPSSNYPNLIINQIHRPLTAPRSLVTLAVPGRRGAYFQRVDSDVITQAIDITIIDDGADFESLLDSLKSWLLTDVPAEMSIDNEAGKTGQAILDGSTNLTQIVELRQGTLNFVFPDGVKYGNTYSQNINDPNTPANANATVQNNGTVEVYPVFTATILKPTEFLSIITPYSEILLGQPATVEQAPTDKYQLVFWDQLASLSNWTTGTYVDDGTITGTMGDGTGYQFQASDYGTNASGWHGPAVLRTLTTPLTDFQIALKLANLNDVAGLGRAEMYLLDANDNEIAKMSIRDMHNNLKLNKGLVTVGSETLLDSYGDERGAWNDFDGLFFLQRIGNEWKYGIGRFDSNGNEFARHYGKWIDSKNLNTAAVAKIELYLAQYETYAVTNQYFKDLKVYQVNSLASSQVPHIAQTNDVITIDNGNRKVLINGIDSRVYKDIGTDYFSLPPGYTQLSVYPSDAAQVNVQWTERWL